MARWRTFLPRVIGEGPTAQVEQPKSDEYVLSLQESELIFLAKADPGQQRKKIIVDFTLCRVARARAMDMATRDYFSHTDPDGKTPNEHVRAAGYALPSHYALQGNNVESIAGGYLTAESCWEGWLKSPGHRVHVLGESGFHAEQERIGVGLAIATVRDVHYWVFISCV